jgi:hypothetical protein
LLALFPDDCAVLARHLNGPVGGIVVVHVYRCIGQRLAKVPDNCTNAVFFVETRHEYGNTVPALLNSAACPALVIYWIFNGLHHEQILPDAANDERELCTVFRPETVTWAQCSRETGDTGPMLRHGYANETRNHQRDPLRA